LNSVSLSAFKKAFTGNGIFESLGSYDSAMDIGLSIFLNSQIALGLGKSYLASLTRPIPRAIWSGKPREIDIFLNETIFPAMSKNVGISFSGFSEPIYNFGVFGIVLFGLLIGNFLSKIGFNYCRCNLRNTVLTALCAAFSFNLLRGNLSSSYSQLVFPFVSSLISFRLIHPSPNREDTNPTP
jgi:hypothetical protein